jgi:DNA-binding MarR family transcriptional regulator
MLSEQVPRFMRLVHALKTQAAKNDSGDRAALVLLFPLVRMGPLRQGALAELVHADPSTVSRHVAALVERGLVQRVADESDGRTSPMPATRPSTPSAVIARATSRRSRPAGTPRTSCP